MASTPAQLQGLIRPLVEGLGYRFWGLQFARQRGGALLRVFIDTAAGVTVDDCQRVSDQLSALLDVEDPIRVPYTLEVSSPGMDRPLFELAQYREYIDERLSLRLHTPREGGRRKLNARLLGVDDQRLRLELEDGELLELDYADVEQARVLPQF
jgi:ribosome maturation factor RimP